MSEKLKIVSFEKLKKGGVALKENSTANQGSVLGIIGCSFVTYTGG